MANLNMGWTRISWRIARLACWFAGLLGISGCSAVGYYLQSVQGQMQIIQARQPIADVIANPATRPELKAKLQRLIEIREFAVKELKLPDNLSYRSYADLRRPYVVWNVFASEEFSIEPKTWCFPIAGCVGYRGYFAQTDAEQYARGLRQQGLETHVGGVPAYSTLGWFDDPVLNTFVHYPDFELARLVFHELSHQVAYAAGDSQFNESYAVAVEIEGVRRWIAKRGDRKMRDEFEKAQHRRAQFVEIVIKYREELAALYRTRLAPVLMRERKAGLFVRLKSDYQRMRAGWDGFAGYDRFFEDVNNASLASIAIYHALVPSFQRLLEQQGGDLAAFHVEVKKMAAMSKEERNKALALLATQAPL